MLHAHIEKQRLYETEIYKLDPMTAQLTNETRLTSIALFTGQNQKMIDGDMTP